MFIIEYYVDENGNNPVENFIKNIDNKKLQAKVFRAIHLLEEKGHLIDTLNSKYLSDDLFELRIKQSTNLVRILYFFRYGKRIVLTHGFIKKSRETPKRELEIALKRMHRYIKREEIINGKIF